MVSAPSSGGWAWTAGQAATLAAKARPVAQPLNLLRIAISWFAAALALPGRLAGCREPFTVVAPGAIPYARRMPKWAK